MIYFTAHTLAMLAKAPVKSKKKDEIMPWQIITHGKQQQTIQWSAHDCLYWKVRLIFTPLLLAQSSFDQVWRIAFVLGHLEYWRGAASINICFDVSICIKLKFKCVCVCYSKAHKWWIRFIISYLNVSRIFDEKDAIQPLLCRI